MPENNYSTKSGNLKLPYTVIIWLNIFKETGRIFYRHMTIIIGKCRSLNIKNLIQKF